MRPIIIAIDGYSSCGKSTLAKALAEKLGYAYMDTGAMYRAVTLYFLNEKIEPSQLSETDLDQIIDQINISFKGNFQNGQSTYLNGENVEQIIRGKAVSEAVSQVSQVATVRKHMVSLQRKSGAQKKIVVDGRDIGTVVFPDAELKIFMTADPEIRAKRRYEELKSKGQELSLEEVRKNLEKRDYNDTHRKENPLRQANDAIVLDNSDLNQEEQLEKVIKWVEERVS